MTYYVVAQLGRMGSDSHFVIDYMLETIGYVFLGAAPIYVAFYYLLFKLFLADCQQKVGVSGSFNLLLNNEKNNKMIQSAGNCKGSSETTRQCSNSLAFCSPLFFKRRFCFSSTTKDESLLFYSWLAGVIDGDGNFDIRKNSSKKFVLKAIRIKLHNRDLRILTRIQNFLHFGRILSDKKKPYAVYTVSTNKEMRELTRSVNGFIRIKFDSFKKACSCLELEPIQANYTIDPWDPYFAGLIDTDGSIVFNYASNRIECNLEFKFNVYTQKLNFNHVIPHSQPTILLRKKKNNSPGRLFKSIAFKFQTVNGMIHLYDYFMRNRLFSDFKFYRISKIKKFIEIRSFSKYPKDSAEFKVYSSFVLDWIKYQNPLWTKVPFVEKLQTK